MSQLGARVPLPGGVALLLLLLAVGGSDSASSHSLRYLYVAVSEPSPGLPRFNIVGYVDGQPFNKYDGILRRDVPLASWMEEFGKEDPQYWERNTRNARITESMFRADLENLQNRYNQKNSTGLHTLQWMYGCEMSLDGKPRGGHYQFAYNGEDYIALDMRTFTWTASEPHALETTRKWETERQWARRTKEYLEGLCVKSLWSYLVYGNKTLQRTEAPAGRVASKRGYNGQETLFCQLYGFYPEEIEVTWMKDGEDQKPDTFTGGIVPNSDGTYHTWLSIKVDSKERDHYQCRVEHDSLPEPLDLAREDPASNLGLLLGLPGGVLAVAILVGVIFFLKKHNRQEGDYKATLEKWQPEDDFSTTSSGV